MYIQGVPKKRNDRYLTIKNGWIFINNSYWHRENVFWDTMYVYKYITKIPVQLSVSPTHT